MSLRFFTRTRAGELMSRLNNDVVGAQGAITGTLVTLISNTVSLALTLAVMLSLEWRLTLLSYRHLAAVHPAGAPHRADAAGADAQVDGP